MVKINSVDIRRLTQEGRFNPKYFHFLIEKDVLLGKSDLSFIQLSNKDYFPTVSDGIHSRVSLSKNGKIKYLYVHSLKEGFIDITDNVFLDNIDHIANIGKEIKNDYVLLSVVGTLVPKQASSLRLPRSGADDFTGT